MPWRRRILLPLAAAALFAMHGATASGASAAVPGHVHTGVASPAVLDGPDLVDPALDGPEVVGRTGAEGHAAMARIVMLAAGLALVAGMRRVARTHTASDPSAGASLSASRGRSPPLPLRASLCVCWT